MIDGASDQDVLPEAPRSVHSPAIPARLHTLSDRVGTLASAWEGFAIVVIAAFLRLFHIEVTDFDYDQANIFRMAYGAVQHHWLVATANGASIPILNPPAIIYFLMLPAAVSANPLWAAVMVALSATAAVLLTYLFVRRYFGRLAGTFAALLFATAGRAVFYSRFSWQQNFIPFFLLLFLFALFAGVVERRRGWLVVAIALLGLLYQLHATTALLAAPLLVAILLSPGTIRWRDLAYGLLSLLVLYAPYLLWELAVHFADVRVLLAQSSLSTTIDTSAINYYLFYFSPYATPFTNGEPFTNAHSVLYPIYPLLSWLRPVLTALILAAALLACLQVLWARSPRQDARTSRPLPAAMVARVYGWWRCLRATPRRCALLVLLTWQIVPLLSLSRHSLPIYPHYLIVLMPGQYMLIGMFLAQLVTWLRTSFARRSNIQQEDGERQERPMRQASARYNRLQGGLVLVVSLLVACIVAAQFVGSTGNVLDYARGNYSDTGLSRPYYNDLHSLQNALKRADALAMQRHLHHVYIGTDVANQTALTFLAGQMHTPTTLFDGARCVMLPDPASGPAVLLLGPRSSLASTLVARFTHAMLIEQPRRLGGPPFQLYTVSSQAAATTRATQAFQHHLSLLDGHAQHLTAQGASWQVTRWQMLHTEQADFRVTYGYRMTLGRGLMGESSECTFNAMQAGDQLLVAVPASLPSGETTMQAQFATVRPRYLVQGNLTFETDAFYPPHWTTLATGEGKQSITVPA